MRSKACKEEGKCAAHRAYAGGCSKCYHMANRPKIRDAVLEWSRRIDYVKLLHMSIADTKQQARFAEEMQARYPDVCAKSLANMSYPDLLVVVKRLFMHIGAKYHNNGLKTFLERNLNFLQTNAITHLHMPQDIRPMVEQFVKAISDGTIGETEIRLSERIAKGSLKFDPVCRTLVPALLAKADRLRRGKNIRTGAGTSQLSPEADLGIAELGFALGQALNLKQVQQAFGLSRYLSIFKYFWYILMILFCFTWIDWFHVLASTFNAFGKRWKKSLQIRQRLQASLGLSQSAPATLFCSHWGSTFWIHFQSFGTLWRRRHISIHARPGRGLL